MAITYNLSGHPECIQRCYFPIHIPLLSICALHYTCVPTDVHVNSQFGTKRLLLAYYRYLYNMEIYIHTFICPFLLFCCVCENTTAILLLIYACRQNSSLSSQFITLHVLTNIQTSLIHTILNEYNVIHL